MSAAPPAGSDVVGLEVVAEALARDEFRVVHLGVELVHRHALELGVGRHEQVEVQRDVFLFNMNLQAAQENGDIARLRKAIADDDRIVALRRSVREVAESKLRNGIIDTHDLLSKITDESTASMARSMREIELLKAIYEYKHTINR